MGLELRAVHDDEMLPFLLAVGTGFGMTGGGDGGEYPIHLLTPDRSLLVRDHDAGDDAVVATAASFATTVTVPGGARVPAAAVSCVSVHPTHRRRGLLRQLMTAQLDDVASRGEPIAILTASESSIYERFGYGPATAVMTWEIESTAATLASDTAGAPGSVRFADGDDAAAAANAVYERMSAQRVGELARPEAWWAPIFRPGEKGRRFFTAVHADGDGRPDAFVRYTIDAQKVDGVHSGTLRVIELQAVDAVAEAAMWHYVFGVDLIATVTAGNRPVDEPLRWRLPDPRRLRVRELHDHLWVRVLDVAVALAARTYGAADSIVLDVRDDFRPTTAGRWRVASSAVDGSATCARTDDAPDLALDVADLGAAYLGGASFATLAAAGRVRELTPGAMARADRMFAVQPAPWCSTNF